MHIRHIQLRNFRCFPELDLAFKSQFILITGLNGSGKTSILEALHYACYLRSFRTFSPRNLVLFDSDNFFVKVSLSNNDLGDEQFHDVQVGFAGSKKQVKVDQKSIASYKELTEYYRIVSLTDDDILLIKGGPEIRRSFLDQALAIENPAIVETLRLHKKVVQSRNALLAQRSHNKDSYEIWTKKMWECGKTVQAQRISLVASLQKTVTELLPQFFDDGTEIVLIYKPKKDLITSKFEEFMAQNEQLQFQENVMGRSLFGAHLDDLAISFRGKKSKTFSSRGQQKLALIVLKIAQIRLLVKHQGQAVFLLDDFMSDFDPEIGKKLLKTLVDLAIQVVLTTPVKTGYFEKRLVKLGAQVIDL